MGYQNLGKRAPKVRYPNGVAPGSVGPGAFIDGAVGSAAVAAGSITNLHVAVGANILGSKLADLSVDSQQIAASAITGLKLAPSCVDNSKVAAGANIDAAKLLANSVGNTQLATTGLDVSKFTTGSLSLARLAAGALAAGVTINNANWSGTALADGNIATGITASKVSGALSNASLAASALTAGAVPSGVTIDAARVTSGTMAGSRIAADGTLPAAALVGNSIGNSQLALTGLDASRLTTGTLAGSLVGTGVDASKLTVGTLDAANRIAAGAISNAHLASGVDGQKLIAGSVKRNQIGARQISSRHFHAGGITADRVANAGTQPLGDNLVLQSEAFDNATWTKTGIGSAAPTVTANAAAAPDVNTTAEQVAIPAVAAGNTSIVSQAVTVTADVHTFSVWLKSSSGTVTVYVMAFNGSTYYSAACSVSAASWTRFSVTTGTLTAASWTFAVGIDLRDAAQSGSGSTRTVYAWGAQVEQAPEVGPYVATTTAQATDAASTYPTITGLTESHIASINASVATITNLNATNISTGSLNLARLASGAIPSTTTVADANFTGTLTASKVANGLVAAQITSVNPSALTGSGTIPNAAIADGSLTPAKLTAFQRSGFLYKLAADSGVINSLTAITFGTKVYDALLQRSGSNFIPNASGTWEWTVRLRLEGGDIVPGYGISVVLFDVTAGTVLYTSPQKMVFSDPAPAGDLAAGTFVDACIAELDWSIPVVAGNSYAIGFSFIKDIHHNTTLSTWAAVYGQANAKADYTNANVASVQIAGSYVRVRPVIQ